MPFSNPIPTMGPTSSEIMNKKPDLQISLTVLQILG
jgi:hypothetical protein